MMLRRIPAAGFLLAVVACKGARASPSNGAPSNPFSDPTSPLAAFFGDSSSSSSSSSFGGVFQAGGPLSSPTNGQISFRTKTRNGVRGLLPKPPRLRLWEKAGDDEGLDTAKRFLHITAEALVLEVEGEDECLSIARGPESLGGARVRVVARKDAGIEEAPAAAAAGGDSRPSTRTTATRIPVDGLFGVYDLLSGPFVAVISRSSLRYANGDLGVEFRQVSKVQLVPVLAAPRALDDGQAREEARLLALLALAFRSHQFYFSHVHDVTQTLQTLRVSSSSSSSSSPSTPATPPPSAKRSSAASVAGGALSSGSGARKVKSKRQPVTSSKDPQKKRTGAGRTATAGTRADDDRRRRNRGAEQRQGSSATPPTAVAPPPDERFFWNLGVLEPLLELREELEGRRNSAGDGGGAAVAAVDRWLTPVMSGFLQVERGCRAGERSFDVMFVSRRSRLRQGTRYTRRGIDDVGNVANFVETEQSLLHEDRSVTSHVQIRGSIPVFWSSPTNLRYHPKVRIDPNQEASLRALRRHSEDLIRLYGKNGGGVVFINLVDKKKEQGALGEAFGAALKAVEDGDGGAEPASDEDNTSSESGSAVAGGSGDGGGRAGAASAAALKLAGSLRHVWFDFHHECRNMHWENLDKLLGIVDREFGEQGFYHAGPGGEILGLQDGVVRTNCMDCLDRTNVVQSLLARRSMLVQLSAVGVDIPEPEGGDSAALALTLDMLEMPAEELERRFRDVWGNNADEISMLYAGTPALKGDFTRTGQRTKMGLLQDGTNSAIRYVVNNFQDHRRQEAVDLLLGFHRPVVDQDGNILGEFIQDPLDLDLWATRLPQPHQDVSKGQSAALAAATEKRGGGGGGGTQMGYGASFCATAPSSVGTPSKGGHWATAAAAGRGGRGGGGETFVSPLLSSPRGAGSVGCDTAAAGVLARAETVSRGVNDNDNSDVTIGRSRHPTEEGETVVLTAGLTRQRKTHGSDGPASHLDRKRKIGDAEVATGVWSSVAGRAEGAGDGREGGLGTTAAVSARRKGHRGSGDG